MYNKTATYSYSSKFSFLQWTFTIQLPTDGRATCRIGIKNACPSNGVGHFAFRYQGNGAELFPANILIPLERQLIVLQLCR